MSAGVVWYFAPYKEYFDFLCNNIIVSLIISKKIIAGRASSRHFYFSYCIRIISTEMLTMILLVMLMVSTDLVRFVCAGNKQLEAADFSFYDPCNIYNALVDLLEKSKKWLKQTGNSVQNHIKTKKVQVHFSRSNLL